MSPSSFAARLHTLHVPSLMLIIGASALFFLFVMLVLVKTPSLSCGRGRKSAPKPLLPTTSFDLTWPSPSSALPESKAALLGVCTKRNLLGSLLRRMRVRSTTTLSEDVESRLSKEKERPHTFIPQHWPRSETPLSSQYMATWQDHESRTSSPRDSTYSVDAPIEDRLTTFVPRRVFTLEREGARRAMLTTPPLSTPEAAFTRPESLSRSPCPTVLAPSPHFTPAHTRNRHRHSHGIPPQWRMQDGALRAPATRASMDAFKRADCGPPGLPTPPPTPVEPMTPMPAYYS